MLRSALNFAVDVRTETSRTGQIIELDDFLERASPAPVFSDTVSGVHSIVLDDDMARIRAALHTSSNAVLRRVGRSWDVDYANVLRALFARDATPPGRAQYAQAAPFAEAYLVRVLRAHARDVDWHYVLTEAVATDRVTLVDAALTRAATAAPAVFGRAPRDQAVHDATVTSSLLALARRVASRRVQRALIAYIRHRASFDNAFAAAYDGALPSTSTGGGAR